MIVKSHMGEGSFTRLNPIHTCTIVSYKKKPSLNSPPFSCLRPNHTFQYERLIFKHMYDMFTRESESMHTPFSEDFVDLDILICLDVLDLQILLHFGNFLT